MYGGNMQFKTYTIPLYDNKEEVEELNLFLRENKIINVQKNLIQHENKYYWNFLVEYIKDVNKQQGFSGKKKSKVDYKEILSPEDFAVFSKLRELRKDIAEKNGIPVYAVFTNDQLSEIVTKKITTKSKLKEIPGIGEQKVNFADSILEYMKGLGDGLVKNETDR